MLSLSCEEKRMDTKVLFERIEHDGREGGRREGRH